MLAHCDEVVTKIVRAKSVLQQADVSTSRDLTTSDTLATLYKEVNPGNPFSILYSIHRF